MESLPLFPLGTVLLPGMPLPLRIFEPRYVTLVTQLARKEWEHFGVVAIRRGHEVGARLPELYDVGCAAVLESLHRDEQQIAIEAAGRRRFRIEAVHDDRAPYLVADVTWLDDDASAGGAGGAEAARRPPVSPALVAQAQAAFTEFAGTMGAAVEGLPDDPALLTASVLDGLGQPLHERQAVLEAGGTAERLRAVTRLARREEALFRVLACRPASVTPPMDLSPN